jgi:hypothetical protein
MNIQQKKLHGGRTRNCLVIPLGDGIKVQHPVVSESEAIALYSYYSNLHPHLRQKAAQ